ncbi:(2Fe-2S)-binding protein [Streptantibioticus parmotrematis]|uniref:(2Fe-2S)-binding protein n=1 Tax=Streptantibioticus parmotrematis TaxID=2873249 RepID=UPI0027DECB84|nr:(2Fe-2S)-binding protein [Streptantibioticus parmotrematis]
MPHEPDDRTDAEVCRVHFGGRTLTAQPGLSVAAALVREGITSWRSTRRAGGPRGLFCGIGVCYDCLITVDGHPDQRACLVAVRDGMRLEDGRCPEDDRGTGPDDGVRPDAAVGSRETGHGGGSGDAVK